jgi:hypothetical protein
MTINDAYINALLADAAYVSLDAGLSGDRLMNFKDFMTHMTLEVAQFIGDHFSVVTQIENSTSLENPFASSFDATVWKNAVTGTESGQRSWKREIAIAV